MKSCCWTTILAFGQTFSASNYLNAFNPTFLVICSTAALVPFLLAGVADTPQADRLFQPDRIHPTAEAHPRMLANVWTVMKPWLR